MVRKQYGAAIAVASFFLIGGLVFIVHGGHGGLMSVFSSAECPDCNVIVVTLDTLGAKHMGLYGYDRPTTPFLDSFGLQRAIVFDEAIAQGSFTPTSHVSILTGRYPAEYGIFTVDDKLPPEAKTLAESLKERGYATHAVSAAILIQPKWGWGQGFDSFDERWFVDSVHNNDASTTFSLATDWVRNNKSKPFFLFINTNHLHSPHTPASEQVLEEIGAPPQKIVDERDVISPHLRAGRITKADTDLMRNYYDGLVRELDAVVDNFVQELDQMDVTRNTIIIFEGDHSEQFGEHGIVGWYNVYDTQIHVPFILYVPGQKPRRVSSTVELRSIPATVLDLIGAKPDPEFTGASLVPLLNGQAQNTIALTTHALSDKQNFAMLGALMSKAPSVWEAMKVVAPPQSRKAGDVPKSLWYSARNDHWQLIKNDNGKLELYDLQKDPEEKNNLVSQWYELSVPDRKEALGLFKALGADIPASCGPYCP